MGAQNSTPETASFDNTQTQVPIHVTPSVVNRLENASKEQNNMENLAERAQYESKNEYQKYLQEEYQKRINERELEQLLSESPKTDSTQANNQVQSSSYEVEEKEFNRTCESVTNTLNAQNMKLERVNNAAIAPIRRELIKCLHDNPDETLECAHIAEKYHQTVFNEQRRTLNQKYGDNDNKKYRCYN